ncbi:alanine racemase [Paenarthrobacter nitroguajacolicus]|uniref:alanine racemase n=1 Tax=Paenarthrobacter nitroguajacolicus TaxID=211146 RepID=UPI002862F309|nr:alanine racemase [Paenarthrobacter nitroguajacolicus]MDR6987685.1 alanine racemase [Paenarthrobacter nitroguajacolicus]
MTYEAAADIGIGSKASIAKSAVLERSAVIDLEAVRHNVRQFVAIASPASVMAVVKADAYGHGAVQVARAALDAGAAWLGVAHISEALALRAAGVDAPLLAWLHTRESNFQAAVAAGIDVGISGWELDAVVAAAREQERPARVHLKVDTGLGRNGCTIADWDGLVGQAMEYQDQGLLRVVGIFSHLAVADEPHRPETDEQLAVFREAIAMAEDAGVDMEVRHIANTPATLSRPDSHFDLVRVGLGVYGLSPFEGATSAELGLHPAMTVRTLLSNCKKVPTGQGVSYGLNYRTTEESTLGLVPLGYADGVPRIATGGPVRVDGINYPVVGRIAMDQMVIDLGPLSPEAAAGLKGAEAVMFGNGADGGPTADDWAAAAGTNNYEIVTRISPRVPRSYVNEAPAQVEARTAAGKATETAAP